MAGRPLRTFTVLPHLPPRLLPLQKLAYNLWWCWNPEAVALFRRIDADAFEVVEHSPIKLLGAISQERYQQLLHDDGFLAHMDRIEESFEAYLAASTWFKETHTTGPDGQPFNEDASRIAYFSAEFGLHESVPVYSGGLGILSGDHLKSASDLGLPLVGVGLMYREGYFRQYLTVDGWQQERYPENDFFNLPLVPESKPDGSPLLVGVHFPGREVFLRVWRIAVGRISLYLLDTNIPQNNAEDRTITARLYGGDTDMRIRQEMILGIGGVRALVALGKRPIVCHMNEGHSAFCGLERIRTLIVETGVDFATAREAVQSCTVFTTHTPVPAGNDAFDVHQIEHYFSSFIPQLKIDKPTFLNLGRQIANDPQEKFGMTVLAIRLANVTNGVSKLHGDVSRKMWKQIWPGLPENEVPITSITNGVHVQSWLSGDIMQLYDRYLGTGWRDGRPDLTAVWQRVEQIPDAELWRTHERRRGRLVAFVRQRLKQQLRGRGAPPSEIDRAEEVLDPEALTIGFARRFATYKRGNLIFRNMDRLLSLLNDKERPIQLVFSGKAHPKDHGGKELISEILQFTRRPECRRRVVFLEDYDMNVARYLVQGVDVWLNNPRRPLEASGTSGMKVSANGGLNLSILDGWWVEGYAHDNGFAIGAGEEYTDLDYQDDVESRAIYDMLEQEIVPLFYTRSTDGLPRGWVKRMKRSIGTLNPVYSTGRMVAEYVTTCYWPSAQRYYRLAANKMAKAAELARWRQGLGRSWGQVRVETVDADAGDPMKVGSELQVKARVHLGSLTPGDVEVQLFHGLVDSFGEIPNPRTVPMATNGTPPAGGVYLFHGKIPCRSSGHHGFAVRVLPRNGDLSNAFEPGLLVWG